MNEQTDKRSSIQQIIDHLEAAHNNMAFAIQGMGDLMHDLSHADQFLLGFKSRLVNAIADNATDPVSVADAAQALELDIADAVKKFAPKRIREGTDGQSSESLATVTK